VSAAQSRVYDDLIPGTQACHTRPQFRHNSGSVRAKDKWVFNVQLPTALPHPDIQMVQRGGLHVDHNVARSGLGFGEILLDLHTFQTAVLMDGCCSHYGVAPL
jgi:hypothetical protein